MIFGNPLMKGISGVASRIMHLPAAEAATGLYGIAEFLSGGVFPDFFISGNLVYNPGQFSETRF